jgi:large subunit ribosomal protein L4e
MKTKVQNLQGKEIKDIDLPKAFSEEVRPDLIKRAVLSLQSSRRQDYGASLRAGMDYSAKLSRRRKKYRGGYGRSMSRIPRKVMLRRGTQFVYTGAVVSGTVGGRRAHPPKAEKDLGQAINKRENRKAIRSAIAATAEKKPIVIEKLESLSKSKDALSLFTKLGFEKEVERGSNKKIRPGKGTLRGRKYRKSKGILVVVSNESAISKACRNLAGFDVSNVNSLNAELLAPGAVPGRLTVWSLDAIEKMNKEKLFE